MPSLEGVLTLVPDLRRYALVATGSRHEGDRLVEGCLQALTASPHSAEWHDRVGLFRLFHEVNGVPPFDPKAEFVRQGGKSTTVLSRIGLIDGEARMALMLVNVIGMSPDDAAAVLGRDVHEVRRMVAAASRRLLKMADAHVLIIEDDVVVAHDLSQLVERLGPRVSGPAATYDEAMSLAAQQAPTLVLADVQLRDGRTSGLLAGHALAREHHAPLILMTAYPERLIQLSDFQPLKVFTKPFNYSALKETITSSLALQSAPA